MLQKNLFELILKSVARLYKIDPDSRESAERILRDLADDFTRTNSFSDWGGIIASNYFSYSSETLKKIFRFSPESSPHKA